MWIYKDKILRIHNESVVDLNGKGDLTCSIVDAEYINFQKNLMNMRVKNVDLISAVQEF